MRVVVGALLMVVAIAVAALFVSGMLGPLGTFGFGIGLGLAFWGLARSQGPLHL